MQFVKTRKLSTRLLKICRILESRRYIISRTKTSKKELLERERERERERKRERVRERGNKDRVREREREKERERWRKKVY